MASPANPSHPLTPPAEPSSQAPAAPQPSQTASQAQVDGLLSQPLTSLTDNGQSKRPRDHRLIHLILASHGISAYQERVPLQLMDFAYRHTSALLSDALHIQNEGYDQADGATQTKGGRAGKNQNKNEEGDISLACLRMAISSKINYQMQGRVAKDFLKGLADERNRISLNTTARDGDKVGPMVGGIKLPHEKYCLTGIGWGLKDEWDSEGEESMDDEQAAQAHDAADADMMQMDGADDGGLGEDEEGLGEMEDVFGPDNGDAGNDGDDHEMQDL